MEKWYKKIVLSLCAALIMIYAWPQCRDIFFHVQFNLNRFILLKTDYEQLYEISPLYRIIKEIKNTLPDNAKVTLSSPSNQFNLNNIIIRYHLYPCIITPDWSYYIDMNHALHNTPPGLQLIQLPSGTRIFAKSGHPWRTSAHDDHGKLISKNLFLFFCLTLWLVLIGSLILKGCALKPVKGNGSWFYSSAYLMGLLVFCIPLWGILMLGALFNQLTVFNLIIIISISSFLFYNSRTAGAYVSPSYKPSSTNESKKFLEHCSDGISMLMILVFLGIIISIPISVWDEMCIWILKAKIFCAHQGLDLSYTGATNSYYPILWPLNNAFYFLLIGDHDEISKWISALTFFAFLAQLKGCLFFLGIKRPLLWPLVTLYLILFQYWTFYTALPENLLMALLTAMTAWTILWFKDPLHSKKYLTLGLVMALGLTLVKFEGAVIACLGGLSLFLAQKNFLLRKWNFLYGGLFLALLFIPWGWSHWVQAQGNSVMWYHLRGSFSIQNINIMIKMMADFLLKNRIFFLIGPALLSFMAMRNSRPWTKEENFLLFWSMTMVLFSITAGLFWPSDDLQKYYPEVLPRLLIRATPALMLVWAQCFIHEGLKVKR